jgi:hypothetical protein
MKRKLEIWITIIKFTQMKKILLLLTFAQSVMQHEYRRNNQVLFIFNLK